MMQSEVRYVWPQLVILAVYCVVLPSVAAAERNVTKNNLLRQGTIELCGPTDSSSNEKIRSWTKLGRASVVFGSADEQESSPTKNIVTVANGTLADLSTPLGDAEFSFRARMAGNDDDATGSVQIWGAIRIKDGESRYVVGLRGAPEPQLSFARYAPDNEARFLGYSPLDPAPESDQWHTLHLVTIGNRFLIYVDDEPMPRIDVEDPEPLWSTGGVGIGGGWLPVEFDDVRVIPLSDERRQGLRLLEGRKLGPEAKKFNFQPNGDASVEEWLVDDGSVYSTSRGYGWDVPVRARRRGASRDPFFDSLVTISGKNQKATFLVDALNEGEYLVSIQIGDPRKNSRFALYVQEDEDPFAVKSVPKGTRSLLQVVVVVKKQVEIRFERTSDDGISINWLVVEKRDNVPEVIWNKVDPSTIKAKQEAQRAKERKAYTAAQMEALPDIRGDFGLDGKWLFMPDQFVASGAEPFSELFNDESWHTIDVPSFWTPSLTWLYGQSGMPNLSGIQANRGPTDKLRTETLERVNSQTFDWNQTRIGWYRHYIYLPDQLDGRNFVLEFGAVAKISQIWINGLQVGESIGMFRKIRVDISNEVKPGRNVIAVRVVGMPESAKSDGDNNVEFVAVTVEVTTKMMNSLPHGMIGSDPSGIWQPVKLIVTAPTHVEDVYIQPQLENATFSVSITNSQIQNDNIEIDYRIVEVSSGDILTSSRPVSVMVPANGAASLTMQTVKVEPKLWSPHEPNLYVLELSLRRGGKIIDQHLTRFGFRTFTIGNGTGKLLLNGKPYWLRGGNHVPSSLDPNNPELTRRFIELAREGNVMITRSHGMPFTDSWFDIADELGMGISYEGTWPWLMSRGNLPSPVLLASWKDEFASLVKRHRNRPSLLIWCVNNEMKFMSQDKNNVGLMKQKWEVLDDMISTMRSIDPTRPIVASSGYYQKKSIVSYDEVVKPFDIDDGDIDVRHSYHGWYRSSHFNLFQGEYGADATPGRPFISQELSTGYPRNDGWPSRYYQFTRYVPQALVGHYAYEQNDPNIFLSRQSFMTKELMEVIRRMNRNECQGLMSFAYLTWFSNGWKADQIRPKKTYFELKKALQPVLVSVELFGRHFYAGTIANRRVCLINDSEDTRDLSSGSLIWELRFVDQVLSRGEQNTPPVAYYHNEWIEIDLKIPETLPSHRVDVRLALEYRVGKIIVSSNSYDLLLASREWSYGASQSKTIQVFDPSIKLGSLLDYWATEQVVGPESLEVGKPLVITGDIENYVLGVGSIDKLLQFVEMGGHVLLHQPGKSLVRYFPDHIKGYRSVKGEIVSLSIPESPIFQDIEPLDLSWFEMGRDSIPYVCSGTWQIDRARNDVSALAHQCDFHTRATRENIYQMAGAPIVEIRLGKGAIVASEMMFTAHEKDPVAARLFRNIISVAPTKEAVQELPIIVYPHDKVP